MMILRGMRISEDFKTKLAGLNVQIGNAISVGQVEGDRPPAFEAGNKAFCAIKGLYSEFEKLPSNWPEFDEGIMIRAIAGLFAEYAKTPEDLCK
jgi:undecaprenyl pyrophosphate synthase